jgi:hypothetical protein
MNLLAASAHLANGSCGIGILSRDPAAASDAFLTNMGATLWSAELSRAAWSRSPFQRTYGMNCFELPPFPNGKVILVFHAESAQPRLPLFLSFADEGPDMAAKLQA